MKPKKTPTAAAAASRYFAYLRVSTDDQNAANQKLGLLEYANAHGFAPLKIVEETGSRAKSWRKRALADVLAEAQRGDVILSPEISRLGESALQVLDFMAEAVAKARRWVPVYEKLVSAPPRSPAGLAPVKLVLNKERYVLRPLQPSDERRMQEFFYSHTQETIESRYGYMMSRMSRERAYELVNVDQTRDLALVILEVQGPREVLHAVGRYYLDADGKSAEVAFVTRETKRRCGMARILFDRLRAEAKKRGLALLHAQVAPENTAMLGLFQSYPHKLSRIPGTTAVHVDMPLAP